MNSSIVVRVGIGGALLLALGLLTSSVRSEKVFFAGSPPSIAQSPLYVKEAVPPLNMLVMGKDHKIYYEAYNDAGDLDGDGIPDVGYKPAKIDYYGYFNSYVCYTWDGGKFIPSSATDNKKCSGKWSGDFLNYVTTSRMDALRRVLYGGWRQTDTATETVLQGAFFPQDAHSWGKEYQSATRDGYDIREYAPVALPDSGKYVLFAVTTVTGSGNAYPGYQAPMLRVLQNSPYRVWNWLSIEGPVAGNKCFNSASTRVDCAGGGTTQAFPGHPANRSEFDTLESNNAVASQLYGSGSISNIECYSGCNPYGSNDNFLTIIEGDLRIPSGKGGVYRFGVTGDDAVDFEIRTASGVLVPNGRVGYYGAHSPDWCGSHATADVTLQENTTYRIKFRHEEATGGEDFRLCYSTDTWNYNIIPASGSNSSFGLQSLIRSTYNLTPKLGGATRSDYYVRVQSCPDNANLRESTCKAYGSHYKPTGILHDYGETQKMYFGLITGSQFNNLEGGVLRRNISNFADEINADGTFKTTVKGIVSTIDRFRMVGGGYADSVTDNLNSDKNWGWGNSTNGVGGNCPSVGNRSITNGECRMWGNPIAEMLYESLRYFAGGDSTPRFATGGASQGTKEEETLGLAQEAFKNPYASTADGGLGYPSCAAPVQTIISDINPSYDGDIPNSGFSDAQTSTGSKTPTQISGFNPVTEGQAIWNAEYGGSRSVFIGEVGGATDGAPTAKTVSSFGNIRGLSPEEPTKGGTYYSASVARFAYNNDINAAIGAQSITTYSIALASPLPRIALPNGITLLPFAKTASGTFGDGDQSHKPTNTIVDFYVQQYENFPNQTVNTSVNGGRPYAVFRINYEDVEQGNDHDMDAIVIYEIKGNPDGSVDVNLTSEYAAGSADQNIGYVVSGTNKDGIYLVVRDSDSGAGSFKPYNLNTPPGIDPGGCHNVTTGDCGSQLPLTSSRTFRPSSTTAAVTLENPLWYAAKYGGPATSTGKPDNYFLVTNPLKLRDQLKKAFDSIANVTLDVGNASISGARVGNASFTLQPSYEVGRNGKDWTGDLVAVGVQADGSLGTPLWEASKELETRTAGSRNIRTITDARTGSFKAKEFSASNLSLDMLGFSASQAERTGTYGDNYALADYVDYLRGGQGKEDGGGGTLRERSSVLGDIVNSEPVIASPRSNYGYGSYTGAMFKGYLDKYLPAKASRKTVAYVGANDGMLHAFDASTQPCSTDTSSPDYLKTCKKDGAGKELFAFVPNAVLKSMNELPKPDASFDHRYFVDGQLTIGDAKQDSGNDNSWKTLLIGSAGAGGRGVFALDVSDPDNFGDASMLWERNSTSDLDIGNVYGKPLLVPLENDTWGVLFGNGYGGNRSDPSLYVLDAFNGTVIAKLTANDGNPAKEKTIWDIVTGLICGVLPIGGELCVAPDAPYNGLGQITSVDRDGDGKVDTVYGGDLQGNLWKFDLSSGNKNQWKVANDGKALFRTQVTKNENNLDQYQPITGGIRVAAGPLNGLMVYFGTGRYFVTGDNDLPSNPQVQSLYAYFDDFKTADTRTVGDLVRQQVASNAETGIPTTRDIVAQPVSYFGTDAKRGWYMDLKLQGTEKGVGERFIATPLIQSGRVFFTTYTPLKNACDPGGENFQYGLDLLAGSGALSNVALQSTGTPACTGTSCGAAAITGKSGATTSAPVMSTGVAAITPTKYIDPDCAADPTKAGCSGSPTFEECQVVIYPGAFVLPRPCGRQSWRQLR